MNKKIVSALLCGTMVLATATPALAGEADGQKIALVGKSAGNAFFEIAAASFKETVEAEGGEVEVVYPEAATADAQIKVLDNLISQDFDAICISANDVNALQAKLEEAIRACDILVNATIMGMKPHEDVTLVDKSLFRKDLVVADTVYNPEKTKMILEAEEAGCKAIGGVGMLQQQGAVNYGLFVGKEMPLAEYQEFQKAQAK